MDIEKAKLRTDLDALARQVEALAEALTSRIEAVERKAAGTVIIPISAAKKRGGR